MSLRAAKPRAQPCKSEKSSLWAPIAASPPRAPSRSPPLLLEEKDAFVLDLPRDEHAQEAPHLTYITPTWIYPSDTNTALIFFDCEGSDAPVLLRDFPRRIFMRNFARLSTERADSLTWRPLVDEVNGTRGFCYLISNAGTPVVRFEAEMQGDELAVVRLVHDDYSPLKHAAGLVAASSFLEFRPKAHLEAMQKARESIKTDATFVYMPTSEFVATAAFHRLILRKTHGDDDEARRVWQRLKRFVAALSELTVECTEAYTLAECTRANCSTELAVERAVRWC